MPSLSFGAHESIAGGLCNAITRGQTATCDVVQVFNKSNNQWRAKNLGSEEIERYFAAQEETGITAVCSHNSYLINLASPDETLNEKSYAAFKIEVERCNLLKIPNLVFHPGSHVGSGEEAGMDLIARNLNRLADDIPDNTVTLCLEATAGQGSNLGYRFEQLAYIIDRIDDDGHVGVCLDSCHIFAAGYPITEPSDYIETMRQFDAIVGRSRIKIFHINDSKRELGSKVDRHEHIGQGEIGPGGFANIVNDPGMEAVAMILETPKGDDLQEDIDNLKLLRSMVRRTE
jgi:deoxyribonuclease-4